MDPRDPSNTVVPVESESVDGLQFCSAGAFAFLGPSQSQPLADDAGVKVESIYAAINQAVISRRQTLLLS